MRYEDAIGFYGTQTKLGEALGISQSTVSDWRGVIPPHYQYQLEVITNGAMRADDELRAPGRVHRKAPHARHV